MRQRIDRQFLNLILGIFGIISLCVLILVTVMGNKANYAYKIPFSLPNWLYLFIGIIVWGIIRLAEEYCLRKLEISIPHTKLILVFTCVLALGLIYLVYNYYFLTGWDAGNLSTRAEEIASGESYGLDTGTSEYYSRYPNNRFLLFLFSCIIKCGRLFGVTDAGRGLIGILIVQCFLLAASGYLLFDITYKIWGSYKIAWNVWLLFVMVLVPSPWVSIPYSDSFGIFLPLLLIYIYLKASNSQKAYFWWFVFGIVSIIGYKIKPQIFITFLAVFLVGTIRMLPYFTRAKKKFSMEKIGLFVSVTLGIFCSIVFVRLSTQSLPISIDESKNFGAFHFVMMGLNENTNGGYWSEDVKYTANQNENERTIANLKEIQIRLARYGVGGTAKHLAKKTLNNYGDGTWGWGLEGSFFKEYLPDKNTTISPMLKSIYYCSGTRHTYYKNYAQTMWLLLLFGVFLATILGGDSSSKSSGEIIIVVALLGLFMFELIFESRSRYLYCYVPFFIMLTVVGFERIIGVGAKRYGIIKKIFGYQNG